MQYKLSSSHLPLLVQCHICWCITTSSTWCHVSVWITPTVTCFLIHLPKYITTAFQIKLTLKVRYVTFSIHPYQKSDCRGWRWKKAYCGVCRVHSHVFLHCKTSTWEMLHLTPPWLKIKGKTAIPWIKSCLSLNNNSMIRDSLIPCNLKGTWCKQQSFKLITKSFQNITLFLSLAHGSWISMCYHYDVY